ncbi:MAG: 16S rRNA (cytosine(967)-C(5))-methyltransferase [Microcoleaceae cyanobacterium]
MTLNSNPRQIAFLALKDIYYRGVFADIALDQQLNKTTLKPADRRLATELIYGCVRRMRSLDAVIDQLAKKPAQQQQAEVRIILHLGLYQLGYLTQIPPAAAVDTTVELARTNQLGGLTGFVNGTLRQYLRKFPDVKTLAQSRSPFFEGFKWPDNLVEQLGIAYNFPDWLIQLWLDQLGLVETEQLCQWFNQTPMIDLRVNRLKTTLEDVEAAFQSADIPTQRLPYLSHALRLKTGIGSIQQWPGYQQGWWMVQDSSAQLVSRLLNPQPGELVIDACAAPGGKTVHIAELMNDQGIILAFDKIKSRLKKLQQNLDRLQIRSVQVETADVLKIQPKSPTADRLLLDAPCSGLGTLHRRADARWRHTPENVQTLAQSQIQLLQHVSTWVKPGGCLVYATCTLHPAENEQVIQTFLQKNAQWRIEFPGSKFADWITPEGWIKVWPHKHQMDGFFIVKLRQDPEHAS